MTRAPLDERLSRLTPAQRAQLASRLRERREVGSLPLVDRSSGRLPMSSAQRRLAFLQRLEPDSPAYNVVQAVRVRGALDVAALRRALAQVAARHEVLRTRCSFSGAEPELVLSDGPSLEVVEAASVDAALEDFAERAERPFDLEREPPLRAVLAGLAPDDHALLFVAHHVASDAWSCRLLLEDLFRAYGGAELAAPVVQYADYAAWQRSQLDTDATRAHLAYWRERLAGMPAVLELPLERPRPAVRSDRGAEIHLDLDGRRVREAARAAAVTPFAVLLTAFGHVLSRFCGTDDVVLGTPVSGRERVEVEDLIGCFVNTLVLRLDLGEAPSRRELVRRVWRGTLADLEHQGLPFEHLVAELNPDRDLSAGPLVQALCNFYPAIELREQPAGLDVSPLAVRRARAKFDLSCEVVDAGDRMRATLTYATELLDRELVARLGEHFLAVVDALAADPNAPAATLPAVPPGEAAPPAAALPARREAPAIRRFEAWARSAPDRVAVRCLDEAIGYRDLNGRANRLARCLLERDPESRPVALLLERSIDAVVAMLAAMKAGLPYVPLDPAMPAEHVEDVVGAAGAGLLLTHAALDELRPALAACSADDLGLPVADDEAMYVLFTSGSTGRPKGVVVEHRQFASYLAAVLDRLAVPDGLSYAIVSTFAADLGLTNLFGALTTGGTLHVLPYEWATDPARLAGYFRRHRIEFMKLVPSHLQAIAEAGLLEAVVPARYLVLAGEACPWGLVDAVRSARPACAIWNHYGPTETTVSVLACPVPAAPPSERGASVPLGFPLDHVRVQVVDRRLRPVPRGAAGELLIAGASVARGYLSAGPAAERFVPDPFAAEPGARAYRSGDRVRVRADGAIDFLGRLDRQVKIRGHRVEPGYVEAALRRHPAVADAAVAVRPGRDGRPALIAYCVRSGDGGPPLAEYARSTLPPYMAPAACVELDRLPLTPNGKIDWRALPEPEARTVRERPLAPARGERDARVAEVWRDVLGLDEAGIDDDFFESGGDSFAAMRLAARLGEGVRVVWVFQHPTIRRLVDFLDGDAAADGLLHRLPGRSGAATEPLATVVAVPYGGGTAAAFADLARALPPELPLYAVELPGHDPGRADQPLEPYEATAARCVEEIRRTIAGPVVVYGQCVGSALAFEVARRLEAEGVEVVGAILGGAFPAPRLPGRLFDLWARLMPSDRWRSDRLYRDLLRATGGLAEELGPAEQAWTLRALRHDARESEELSTRLCHDPRRERTLHALAVVGERDRVTEFHQERYREWNLLCADTELAVIPDAGHYFFRHQPAELAGIVARWTRRRLGVAPAEAGAVPVVSAAPPAADLRGFALVTFGQLVSLVGSRALAFALGVWVYLQTGSVTQFSVILVTALLPGLLALPFAGAAADRWDRRRLMMGGEAANAAAAGVCLFGLATGSLSVWHVYIAASLASIGTAFQQPAYLAAVAQLVPKQYLGRINGVLQAVVAVSQVAGPLAGGALIVLVGVGGVALAALSAVLVALGTLAAVRFPDLLFRTREETIWKEIAGGLRYIARRRPLVAMVAFFLGYNLVLGFAVALIPPMVLSVGTAGTLSLVTMIGAVGGIAGGVAMALWGGFERRATGMVGFVAATGVGMVVAGLRPSPVLAVAGMAVILASVALINGHWQTMIQVKVGMELQGRVLATNRMIANLTEPLGYVGAGWLADAVLEPAMGRGGGLSRTFVA
ncbi:MAG TPA: amino acid adenylation domain-containing protein, partial [Candidatus Dormibacteraeota bacterium]|nr:amino acid adenylation domain-containing protein [Candidatus Dormibacteraeota bacterium]